MFHALLYLVFLFKVHSQPGNQENQWIFRKFGNGLFFTEKLGNYQGILVEYQGNQGKLTFSLKNI